MTKPKKRPYRGPLVLHWCDQCNVPLAAPSRCGRCLSTTRRVPIAPPGDVRPAFEADRENLIATISKQYGPEAAHQLIPSEKILLLNSIPDMDRCYEIILDGQIIGLHRFQLEKLEWEFIPKLEGARRLALQTRRKLIVIHNSAAKYIIQGANVLRPGIKSAERGIETGDSVIVLDESGEVILTGSATMTGEEMETGERGMAVRKRYWGSPMEAKFLSGGQDWIHVLEANNRVLDRLERKAGAFIQKTKAEFNLPVVVAFSGGKDSLAVLLLVKKVLSNDEFHIMFIDTGIEFPETIENINITISTLGLDDRFLVHRVEKEQFFRVLNQYGFVARDFRVCCKSVKLGPTAQLIEQHFPTGCLSFIGQRRYESPQRSAKMDIWKNPWVPNQIGASPIHNWTALMVWLFLFRENAPFNALYRRGFDRIGCMFCPASTMSEFDNIAKYYPKEWKNWTKTAQQIAQKQGLPDEWLRFGFWRWKSLPPKIKELAHKLNIPLHAAVTNTSSDTLSVTLSPSSTTRRTETTIRGQFNRPINLELALAFLPALGDVVYDREREMLQVNITSRNQSSQSLIFQSGEFTISGPTSLIKRGAENLIKAIYRGFMCTNCGVCKTLCAHEALLTISGKTRIDVKKCIRCGECLRGKCPTLYALQVNQ